MGTRQFLGVADPEFAGHQFGEESVPQGGEGAGLLQIQLLLADNRAVID
jgi:hypothetical protein